MLSRRNGEESGRDSIMDVAERLFAERGIDAVSLRTINAEAGYSVAALHYHFATRDGLIRALLARAQPPILEERARMLAELQLLDRPPLERIVDALVRPLAAGMLEKPKESVRRLRFLARLYFDRSPYMANALNEGLQLFMPLLRRALPAVDERALTRRWLLAAELAQHALANTVELHVGAIAERTAGARDFERFLRELVTFIAGGLRAGPKAGTAVDARKKDRT